MKKELDKPIQLQDESVLKYSTQRDLKKLTSILGIPFSIDECLDCPPKAQRKQLCDLLNIDIPEGRLFHPCCGSRDNTSFRLFKDAVSGFNFADPYELPSFQGSTQSITTIGNPRNIKSVQKIGGIGDVCIPDTLPKDLSQSSAEFIRKFYLDGAITLIRYIPDMSIFYYTGDSPGEGGSGQVWLGNSLFPLMLTRLLDGGLIVTDGSWSGEYVKNFEEIYPWYPILKQDDDEIVESFQYAGRKFKRLGEVGKKNGPIIAWHVTNC